MGAVKVSLSIDEREYAWLTKQAKTSKKSLSAVATEAIGEARRRRAGLEVLQYLGDAAQASQAELAEIRASWRRKR